MSELMNIALRSISSPNPKSSLLEAMGDRFSPPPLSFYINNLFSGAKDFESLYSFLKDHFFPYIEWAKLRLLFKKLKLFIGEINAFRVTYIIGGGLRVLEDQVKVIMN